MSLAKMLDLSTAHLPSLSAPDFGGLRAMEHKYGWLCWVYPDCTAIPAWLKPIHDAAVRAGCILIHFDADADEDTSFEKYEVQS